MTKPVARVDSRLLDRARREMSPSRSDTAALRRRVMGAVAVGAAATAAASTAKAAVSSSAKTAAGAAGGAGATGAASKATVAAGGLALKGIFGASGWAAKVGVVALVAGVGVTGAVVMRGGDVSQRRASDLPRASVSTVVSHVAVDNVANDHADEFAAPVVASPVIEEVAPSTAMPSTTPRARRALLDTPAADEVRVTTAPAEEALAVDSLRAEAQMMRDAHRALSHGDSAGALSLLDAHSLQFAGGMLAEERAALRARALCVAGRAAEGRAAAEAFARAYPQSVHGARVAADCQ